MKMRSGFTLIEVLLAFSILISSMFVLSNAQIKYMRRVLRDREDVERIFLAKKEYYQAYLMPPKEEKPIKRELTNPEVRITTETKKLKHSLFSVSKKTEEKKTDAGKQPLRLIVTEAFWKSGAFDNTITLVGVVYQPPQEKEKKT